MKTMTRSLCLVLAFALACQSAPLRAEETGSNLSLDDLGFSQAQTQGDAKLQETLHRRSKMLKTHQILGLATTVPMMAALFTGEKAGYGEPKSKRNFHAAMGMTAGAMYFTTASFALFAPEGPQAGKNAGLTKVHRALAWVHFPAMVLAPFMGYQAKKQLDRGESAHGFAKHHATVAGIAAGSFGAAMLVMVFNF